MKSTAPQPNLSAAKRFLAMALASLFLLAIALLIRNNYSHHDQEESEETDGIEKAMEQEFMLTRDPALNAIPIQRLMTAASIRDAKLAGPRSGPIRMSPVSGINWQERGPSNVGGRTRVVWFDLNDAPNYKKVWAAGVAGGLWYCTDITASTPVWTNVNDFFNNLAISSFAQDPSNPQIMYFGTGEGWFNVDACQGLGIWKSVDGGATWTQLSSTLGFYYVQDLQVDGSGNLYASLRINNQGAGSAGIQKSSDGGVTWTQVLGSPVQGATSQAGDLELASNGDLYATLGTGVANGSIYRSSFAVNGANTGNAGTWTNITPNASGTIPAAANAWKRIELACAPSDANTVYALFQGNSSNDCSSIQRYNASTNTWTVGTVPTIVDQGNNSVFTRSQAWYDLIAAVDPNNANSVYIGGIDALRSDDGGATWTQMSTWSLFNAPAFTANQLVHADQHVIRFAPGSSSRAIWGTDGGIYYTTNANVTGAGNKPTFIDRNTGYDVTQYYGCAIHPSNANYFLAGAQDNGSHIFSAAGLNAVTYASGGDGGFPHIDQDNPSTQITSYVYNTYYVSTDGGVTFTTRSKNNRGQFINPTDYDNTANILYGGDSANSYYRWTNPATNGADASVTVSQFSGGYITHTRVAPLTSNRVFFGLNTGAVVMVDNANTGSSNTGTVIKSAGGGVVSCIAIDPANEDHMLVTSSNYGVTHVYESVNAVTGAPATWTSVDGDLPDMPVRWALFDPRNSNWAILATELGVWSTNHLNGSSTTWSPTNSGLANVRVDMLQYRSSDQTIAAATHGRGLFTAQIPTVSTPDVNFQTGTTAAPEATAASTGCRNYRDYTVRMTIANAPTGDATINLSVQAGNTATEGLDFDYTTDGNFTTPNHSFVFTSGSTASHDITVRVYDDAEVESTENFTLSYTISGTTNAQPGVGPQTNAVSIADNDAAPIASSSNTYSIGTPTYNLGSSSDGQPLNARYTSKKTDFQYKASELTAAGMSAGNITSFALYLTKNSTRAYQNMQIKMGSSSVAYLVNGSVALTAVSTVKSLASYNTVNGWNTFTLDAPYAWDGSSNLVVEICYDNGTADSANLSDVAIGYSDGGTASQGNMFWGNNVNCSQSFSSVGYFPNGIKPVAQIGMSAAGTPVDSTLNSSQTEYLGPYSDLYFYSSTGDIIARIKNLTSHDYGCTQVVIDRAGTGATAFWNNNTANYLMDKTFHVIPTNNDPSGQYTITLYYTQAEVNGWQTATGQAFSATNLVKVTNQISSVTPANPSGGGTVEVVTPTTGTLGSNYTLSYTFNTGFSGFGAGVAGASLPIRLLNFNGLLKSNSVVLNWQTSFEENSYGFEVERSYDGQNFAEIGFVPGAGHSNTLLNYAFTDRDIAQDNNYYRLRMVDLDGKSTYSKVLLIRNPTLSSQAFRVLGNPVQDHLDVQFGSLPAGPVQMRLLDQTGRVLLNWEHASLSQKRVRIDLAPLRLSKGVYVLQTLFNQQQVSSRILKQ